MRKFAAVSSACTVIAGIIGFILRRTEAKTVFDPETLLAEPGAAITWILIAFSVLFFAAMAFVLARMGELSIEKGLSGAFGSYLPVPFFITALASLAIFAGGAVLGVKIARLPGRNTADAVLALFAVLSAASTAYCSYSAFKGVSGSELGLFTIIPVVFLCYWLILSYRQRAVDPVLLDYVYEIMALIFLILGFYYSAGFNFGRLRPRKALFCMDGAIYLGIVTLADGHSLYAVLLYVGLIIVMLVNSMLLASNAKRPAAPDEGGAST